MGNYSNQSGLIHFSICIKDDNEIIDSLYQIFSRDLDFIENVEYFRKNTLKLGYKNEAYRLVTEYVDKNLILNLKHVEKAVKKLSDNVFKNSNFYADYQISVEQIDETVYSVAIAYSY